MATFPDVVQGPAATQALSMYLEQEGLRAGVRISSLLDALDDAFVPNPHIRLARPEDFRPSFRDILIRHGYGANPQGLFEHELYSRDGVEEDNRLRARWIWIQRAAVDKAAVYAAFVRSITNDRAAVAACDEIPYFIKQDALSHEELTFFENGARRSVSATDEDHYDNLLVLSDESDDGIAHFREELDIPDGEYGDAVYEIERMNMDPYSFVLGRRRLLVRCAVHAHADWLFRNPDRLDHEVPNFIHIWAEDYFTLNSDDYDDSDATEDEFDPFFAGPMDDDEVLAAAAEAAGIDV